MKKIINHPDSVVSETLMGLVSADNTLEYLPGVEVVTKKVRSGNVGIVSGGGSGHEPAHAGYVGEGMLDSAVAGNIFSSPSPDRIIEGIRRADSGKGVLLVIKNYSGDIMNFELAEEIARGEGIAVEHVVVRDDVAVEDSTYSTGRRGIAGTVFVHKVAGAAAADGASLADVKAVAEKAIAQLRSMGMAMAACTLPTVGRPGFELADDEIEIGMGIHGEPGVHRGKVQTAKELAKTLTDYIFADYDFDQSEVALMINGLGATPVMELYILNYEVQEILKSRGIRVALDLVGNYMTSVDMAGASVTLLKLDAELKKLVSAPCRTLGLTIRG